MSEPATLEAVLARFLQRDDEHYSAWQTVTAKQQDLGRMLEAVQVELQRMGRTMEAQSGYNERQIKLQETTATHSQTFDRAFNEMREMKSDWTAALNAFSNQFSTWKESHERDNADTARSVTAYNGALKFGGAVIGVMILLIGMVATSWKTAIEKDIDTRAKAADAKHASMDSERVAHGIKIDALSMQVQEVRLDRQRDQEAKQP